MKYPFLDLGNANEPYIDDLCRAAERVIRSGRYVGGPEVAALESELGELLGAPYIIGVSNGLDALRLIMKAYVELGRLRPGDEVIYPANTYVASVLAISDAGLTPVPVDIDPSTLNMDSALIESAVTERTRAIMTVHLYGRVAWDETLKRVADRHGLLIVEDCAQALGARATTAGLHGSLRAGALGHAGGISFYPTKNVGALGDAGAVATHDADLAAAVRALANYGSTVRYHNDYCGYNCRLDPIQAAMLRVKLPHTDAENADRFARALAYSRTIAHPKVETPLLSEAVTDCVWHQYVVRIADGKRDLFRSLMQQAGVGTDVNYPTPPHLQPCYRGMAHGPLPHTELAAAEIVSLPISGSTSVADAAEIGRIINSLQF